MSGSCLRCLSVAAMISQWGVFPVEAITRMPRAKWGDSGRVPAWSWVELHDGLRLPENWSLNWGSKERVDLVIHNYF